MANFGNVFAKFKKFTLNKYFLVFLAFAVFVTFFDNHSLMHRWETHQRILEMQKELKYYKDEIKNTQQKKNALMSSKASLEKFAREHYYMKKQNEDVFIIEE